MLDSGFFDLDTDPADLATGYLTPDDPPETWRSNIYGLTAAGMPDGGMIATAADLARFMEGLLRGRLVSPESLKSMITPHSTPGTEGGTYGYGFEMVVDGGRVVVLGHGGSDPGVATRVNHYPGLDLTVVVLCNQDRGAFAAEARVASAFGAPRHP
jgi:D-alanyl-D-alanine carboxypeptidase